MSGKKSITVSTEEDVWAGCVYFIRIVHELAQKKLFKTIISFNKQQLNQLHIFWVFSHLLPSAVKLAMMSVDFI